MTSAMRNWGRRLGDGRGLTLAHRRQSAKLVGYPWCIVRAPTQDLCSAQGRFLQLRYKTDEAGPRKGLGPILTFEELEPLTREPRSDQILIDVREPQETQLGMIPSAVNIPLSRLPQAMNMKREDFLKEFGFEKPTKGANGPDLVLYCRSGMRSASALEILKGMNFDRLSNYKGSWLDWSARTKKEE